jgi:hypothetical protein
MVPQSKARKNSTYKSNYIYLPPKIPAGLELGTSRIQRHVFLPLDQGFEVVEHFILNVILKNQLNKYPQFYFIYKVIYIFNFYWLLDNYP